MATNTRIALLNTTGNAIELPEQIEWDLPYDAESRDFPDLSNLSLGTEMRNKMWESDNQIMLGGVVTPLNGSSCNSPSPTLDQNQNPTQDLTNTMQYMNGMHLNLNLSNLNKVNSQPNLSTVTNTESYNALSNGNFIKGNGNQSPAGTGIFSGKQQRPRSQPLLQSPIPMPNDTKSPEILPQENGFAFDARRLNENQTIKEELLEMKSIITRLAASTDDISGLPEPVQLALKVIELEGALQESEETIQNQERNVNKFQRNSEKNKQEFEFELSTLKNENQFLKEKLDYKATLEASTKGRMKGREDRVCPESADVEKLKEEIKGLKEELEMKTREFKTVQEELEHKVKMKEYDMSSFDEEINRLKGKLSQDQAKEQQRKAEIERYIVAVRETMERERKDRYILLVEQNKLKHKVEKLSENCKSYQMKNEELCRIQNELEQECDQFRKLKKMIQEHGLPNHEHLVILQQQTEMFKDDVLSERKDRERAQAQRDKLRRDLEILQSRNQSLQEQVYKYQEHIMRLNTDDRRVPQQQDFIPQPHQGNSNRFSRQLSNPAYFNPRIRLSTANVVNPLIKNPIVSPGANPASPNRHSPPVGGDSSRMVNGFHNNMNGRGGNIRSPQNYGNNVGFDPWQQQRTYQQHQQQNLQQQNLQQQQQLQMQQRNSYPSTGATTGTRVPQSPLLGPNGDPWILPPASPNTINQQQMGGNYNSNIWSQQPAPASPNAFNASTSAMRVSQPPSSPSWQMAADSTNHGNFAPTSSSPSEMNSAANLCTVPGKHWSTLAEDGNPSPMVNGNNNTSVVQQNVASEINEGSVDSYGNHQGVDPGGFQCRKCDAKLPDTESFRLHAELCFN